MTAPGSTNWNQETKSRLNEKVQLFLGEVSALSKHVLKSSKSGDLIQQACKATAAQETGIESSVDHLQRSFLIAAQLHHQAESIGKHLALVDEVKDQIDCIIR